MEFQEKEELLHLAESAALLAGKYLVDLRKEWFSIQSASGHDLKIRADRESEKIILRCLSKSNISVFSEETGDVVAERKEQKVNIDSGFYWIVDPLDGSLNYHQGIPLSCVSIALYNETEPVLGVVFDFNSGDLYSGVMGGGAWLNHQPIRPSYVDKISKAVIGTGFPVNADFSDVTLSRFIKEIQQFRKVRLLGSAALSLCYVACGRIDAYREERIMFWDVAAGLILVKSAGGTVKADGFTQKSSPGNVIAANGFLEIL